MNLCKDCKHFYPELLVSSTYGKCLLGRRDVISGKPATFADHMRTWGSCGLDGEKFEPKPSIIQFFKSLRK